MSGLRAISSAVAGLFAVAAVSLVLWRFAGFSVIEATLLPVCLLLAISQFSGFSIVTRRQDAQAREIADLNDADGTLADDMRELYVRLDEVDQTVDERVKAGADAIWTEVQVLETLVKQLAEGIAHGNLETIRAGALADAAAAADTSGDTEPDDDAALLKTIRASLAENRVDLYLQPVVTLPQRKIRYYEGFSRLRSAQGDIIMPASYLPVAEPAGMMPIIDNLLLFRCVQVVRRMVERDRNIGVFCNISAHSLLDTEFFPNFVDFLEQNKNLAKSIIFEFPQRMVQAFGPLEEQSLAQLAELGFSFSMDQATNLDFDFTTLGSRGFRFVKIEADILLNRMYDAGAHIDGPDFCELLSRHGIEMVAEKIEDEHAVVNLLDYNVRLGQGYLFGEPKPVRHDMLDPASDRVRASA